MIVELRFRRGTAAEWAADNTVLAEGEPGWDTTNDNFKIGDGTTPWNDLGAQSFSASDLAAKMAAISADVTAAQAAATQAQTFADASVSEINDALSPAPTQNTGAYTLALMDRNQIIETQDTAAVTITVPAEATVAFPVGSVVEVLQGNTGQVTIAAAAGVTLHTPRSLTTRARWSTIKLRKRAADDWVLAGDLT